MACRGGRAGSSFRRGGTLCWGTELRRTALPRMGGGAPGGWAGQIGDSEEDAAPRTVGKGGACVFTDVDVPVLPEETSFKPS